MENNEIMINDEVMENATEIATDSKKGLKVAAGIGLAVIAGVVIYKISKKIIAKAKAAKEERAIEVEDFEEVECDENSTRS